MTARRGQRAGVEQVALHEQRDVLERDARERRRFDQRLLLALLLRRVLVRDLHLAALGELVLHEHRRGDLPLGDVHDRGGLPVGQPDRIEHEHVAFDVALRDAALLHRCEEVLVGDALEDRQRADQRVVRLEPGWYHRARSKRCAPLMNGQVRHLAGEGTMFDRAGHLASRGNEAKCEPVGPEPD